MVLVKENPGSKKSRRRASQGLSGPREGEVLEDLPRFEMLSYSLCTMWAVPLWVAGAAPTTLYVALNGSDITGDGASWHTPYRTVRHCAHVAPAGATCVLAGGRYDQLEDQLVIEVLV